MKNYFKPSPDPWSGRASEEALYLHQKIGLVDLEHLSSGTYPKVVALLGYACDAGVSRNQGRVGAAGGPDAIRRMLGRLPDHLEEAIPFWDTGNIGCPGEAMEQAQLGLGQMVALLLRHGAFPIVLGGSHDLAYGHFKGILEHRGRGSRIGIINFDAHFDLRSNTDGNNSGTPFYQLAMEAKEEGRKFDYLCLGIRKDANDRHLYETAASLGVHFIEREEFNIQELTTVQMVLLAFIEQVDGIYVTIDLDGFSSAYAPGVSSPSPMGFAPDIVWEALKIIIDSGKLVSMDLVELNPEFDIDNHTARLAASLVHASIHRWGLL